MPKPFALSLPLLNCDGGRLLRSATRLVGPSVAKELIFTGRILSGTEAAEVGLVNGAVSDGTAFEKVRSPYGSCAV